MRRAVDNPLDGAVVDELMRRALAETVGTHPHPNPRVGAIVLSSDGRVLSVAAHTGPGQPHAEQLALDDVPRGDGHTMVVTLEPCDHHGRTPPCTNAIIAKGIAHVVVGSLDPDSRVQGRGIARLRDAGIAVTESGLSELVEANDRGYFRHRRTGNPFVTLKLAVTLDGQIAAIDGTSRWITGREARADAHQLRAEHDAVAVGAGTLRVDDPELTVRLTDFEGPQPTAVVFKGIEDLPPEARILKREPIIVEPDGTGRVNIPRALRELGDCGITALLIEGGSRIARSFLDAGVVDELVVYVGAKLAAGTGLPAVAGAFSSMDAALPVRFTEVVQIGPDIKIVADMAVPT